MPWLKQTPSSILVRMPNWLGDLVMATPILVDLRAAFPRSVLTAMCQSNVATLLTEDPNIDEVFSFHRPSGWLHRQAHRDIIRTTRHGKYDLGILLTNSFSSAWYFWRGHVKRRVGFAGSGRSWMLNRAVPVPKNLKEIHQVNTYKKLLEPLGVSISDTAPKLYLSPEERKEAREILHQFKITPNHTVIGINPGAAYGSAKCWLPERFKEVTQKFLEDPNVRVLYFGDPVTAPLVQMICRNFPETVVDLSGKTTIRQLLALIEQCSVFLTNDSGPMHIAAALDTPLVALFGSTSDIRTSPYNNGTVIHKHVSCSPCYQRVCPIDFRCMKQISVDEVVHEVHRLIS